jgi:hypothetical protein
VSVVGVIVARSTQSQPHLTRTWTGAFPPGFHSAELVAVAAVLLLDDVPARREVGHIAIGGALGDVHPRRDVSQPHTPGCRVMGDAQQHPDRVGLMCAVFLSLLLSASPLARGITDCDLNHPACTLCDQAT